TCSCVWRYQQVMVVFSNTDLDDVWFCPFVSRHVRRDFSVLYRIYVCNDLLQKQEQSYSQYAHTWILRYYRTCFDLSGQREIFCGLDAKLFLKGILNSEYFG